jgi:glycosyltransferase involved in cell wall biosynthesis
MPRILIDARALADSKSGGVSRVAKLWILDQIKDTDPKNCYCVTTGSKSSVEVADFCVENDLNYLHLKLPNKLWTLLCYFNFTSLIYSAEKKLKSPIDLLLLPNLAYTGALYRPYNILVHDLSFIIEPHWFNLRRRLWHKFVKADQRIKNADQIHCVSNQTKSDTIKLLNVNDSNCKIFIFDFKFQIPSSKFHGRPKWLPKSATRIALMLGGSDPRKNIKTALKAISFYNIQNPQKHLVPVVIEGKVKYSLNELHIAHIQAPYFISDAELVWLYQNSSVLLYPSWYEGFGLPLHEAHQFNLPIISSTGGALSETAPHGTILCNPAKIHEWIGALKINQSRILRNWVIPIDKNNNSH